MASLHDQFPECQAQDDARTYPDEYDIEERAVFFKITNPLLFYASTAYLKALKTVSVDRRISRGQWIVVVEQTIKNLNLSNELATVLLAANMAFLAIPSVDDTGADQQLSVTKILICFSVVVNLGSIIIGLYHIIHHTLKQADLDALVSFLERYRQLNHGFERLAIAYSIPHALLMWGMTSFLASFLYMCLEAPTSRSLEASVIITCLLITLLGFWCIFLFWEGSDQWMEQFLALLHRLGDRIGRIGQVGGSILPTSDVQNPARNLGQAGILIQ
ncbi:hypothetical protein EDD85DRAFT_460595 [Armillaria nabsnona]|nr:hypothetical protein EDD85DRAFT_460595 [Armillaria nabsnona]